MAVLVGLVADSDGGSGRARGGMWLRLAAGLVAARGGPWWQTRSTVLASLVAGGNQAETCPLDYGKLQRAGQGLGFASRRPTPGRPLKPLLPSVAK